MPIASEAIKNEFGLLSPIEQDKFLHNAGVYIDSSGEFIQALRPFNFPEMLLKFDKEVNKPYFPYIRWLRYHAPTEKTSEKWDILEPVFVDCFSRILHLHYINGSFWNDCGLVEESRIKSIITKWILPFFEVTLSKKVASILELLKGVCYEDAPIPDTNKIYTAGGYTLTISDEFDIICEYEPDAITITRLPIKYDKTAKDKHVFDMVLDRLLTPEDQYTLCQYAGYCLIPTTKAHKALVLWDDGRTGKSAILHAIAHVLGNTSRTGKISKVACSNRFALAQLENRLLFIDHEFTMKNKSHHKNDDSTLDLVLLKDLVTADGRITAERKGRDEFELFSFCRFLFASNERVTFGNDTSTGFSERFIQIHTKGKPIPDSKADRELYDKLKGEAPAILNWMIDGLISLKTNGFNFELSDRVKADKEKQRLEDNVVLDFLNDEEWIVYSDSQSIKSEIIQNAVRLWCKKNGIGIADNIGKELKNQLEKRGFQAERIYFEGTRLRGYKGIGLTDKAKYWVDNAIF